MTMPYSPSRAVYEGNDAATRFPFSFKVWDASQLVVTLTSPDGATTEASGWTADIGASGGEIVYLHEAAPLSAGWKLAVTRNMPFTQEVNLVSASRFDPQVIEDALDQATAERQQTLEMMRRAVILPATSDKSPQDVVLEVYAARDEAQSASSAAQEARASAGQSAADAAASASTATDKASAASASAASAATQADRALMATSAAEDEADSAAQSKVAAAASATSATTSENNAAASASTATNEASIASASAASAATSASTATDKASAASVSAAKASAEANAAASSAAAAAQSAIDAAAAVPENLVQRVTDVEAAASAAQSTANTAQSTANTAKAVTDKVTPTPTANAVPKADANGKIAAGWVTGSMYCNKRMVITTSGNFIAPVKDWYCVICIGAGGQGGGRGATKGGAQGGSTSFGSFLSARGGSGGGAGFAYSGAGGGEEGELTVAFVHLEAGQSIPITIGAGSSVTSGTADGAGPMPGLGGNTNLAGGGAAGAGTGCSGINTNSYGAVGGAGGQGHFGFGGGGGGIGGGGSRLGQGGTPGFGGVRPDGTSNIGGAGGQGAIIIEYYDPSLTA